MTDHTIKRSCACPIRNSQPSGQNRPSTSQAFCNARQIFGEEQKVYTPKAHHVNCLSSRQRYTSRRRVHAEAAATATPVGVGEVADVEDVEGLRVTFGEANRPLIEYLVKWKENEDHTWEPVENLSDNLLRDFEDKWWKTCRDGDEEAMKKTLETSGEVLAHCVDSNERSALHFSAAVGQAKCCEMLCKAGADVDQPDKDGYTPLHMAVGYSHVAAVKVLLDAGASPEIPDNQGRNVIQLVDSIRESMPYTPQLAGKRLALEEVAALLAGNLFEEVLPKKVLDCRTISNESKEYLVQWLDGSDDSWVRESDMSKEVLEDYAANMEYASAETLLKMKKRGDQRLYLVKWLDGAPNSWEYEDHLSPALISAFESGDKDAFKQLALPETLESEKPLSKRAARRARKAARRASLDHSTALQNGAISNGSSHHSTNGSTALEQGQENASRSQDVDGESIHHNQNEQRPQETEVREFISV